jgi:hypothetical protein
MRDTTPWAVTSTSMPGFARPQHIVLDLNESPGGWVTREGVSSVCWSCDADVREHKPGLQRDVWRCACGVTWHETHRPTPERAQP